MQDMILSMYLFKGPSEGGAVTIERGRCIRLMLPGRDRKQRNDLNMKACLARPLGRLDARVLLAVQFGTAAAPCHSLNGGFLLTSPSLGCSTDLSH